MTTSATNSIANPIIESVLEEFDFARYFGRGRSHGYARTRAGTRVFVGTDNRVSPIIVNGQVALGPVVRSAVLRPIAKEAMLVNIMMQVQPWDPYRRNYCHWCLVTEWVEAVERLASENLAKQLEIERQQAAERQRQLEEGERQLRAAAARQQRYTENPPSLAAAMAAGWTRVEQKLGKVTVMYQDRTLVFDCPASVPNPTRHSRRRQFA